MTYFGMLAAVLLWTWAPAGQPGAAEADLKMLMSRIASAAETSVRYREEKTLSFLEHALVSRGTLRFEEPDRLVREVEGPVSTRYLVSASSLVIEEAGKDPKELRLDQYPAIGTLMATMRAVFAGDLEVLSRLHRIGLETESEGNGWTLDLDPRGDDISRFLSRMKVSGRGGRVRTIETLETGGDRILMTILPDGS